MQPRQGWIGYWDRFVGPGATRNELMLTWVAALSGAATVCAYALLAGLPWSTLQFVVASLLAADLVGGVATNATETAQRWYHRQGQTARDHLIFIGVHVAQIALVAWVFRSGDWLFVAGTYSYLMLVSVVVASVPSSMKRPMAMLAVVDALVIGLMIFTPTPGLEWFFPALVLKLIACHFLPNLPAARQPQASI
jgi:hypothetical protein